MNREIQKLLQSHQTKRRQSRILRFMKNRKISKQEYLAALSAPKKVRLQPWPNPMFERTLPLKIPKATLKAVASWRIEQLAKPKQRKFSVNNKRNRIKISDSTIEILSKPVPKIRHAHDTCLKKETFGIYFRPTRLKMQIDSDNWINHKTWLEKNAAPKKRFNRPKEINSSNMSIKQTKQMIKRLTKLPKHKVYVSEKFKPKTEPRPRNKRIRPMNLPWVERLSMPVKLASETLLNLNYDPYFISTQTLKARASERIKNLAKPSEWRNTIEKKVSEKSFKIPMAVLKYKATKRIKKLAQPRKYK